MKRKICALTIIFILTFSNCATGVEISIDDENVSFCGHTGIPFIDSGNRTQVPLRVVAESLGVDVEWDQEMQAAVLEKNNVQVEVPIGKLYILKNGEKIITKTAARIKDGRIYMPIRSVIEAFGSAVSWNSETQTVEIEGRAFYGSEEEKPSLAVCEKAHPGNFSIMSTENYPGNILILEIEKLNSADAVRIDVDAAKTAAEVYAYGNHYVALLPIDLYSSVGEHDISLTFNEGKEDEYRITKTYQIMAKAFKTQFLVVSESLNQTNRNDQANKEFVEIVKPARQISTPEKLWNGDFAMPIQGRLTTEFAQIRYVNNELSSSRHSGIDLAAALGMEVRAPNNGKVTLAAPGLLSTGNTIVIDHGMGLFTSYYHLNSMNVSVGDLVSKGDVIGTVGSTGFSTGSHLHYAVSLYNTYVNPYQPLMGIID